MKVSNSGKETNFFNAVGSVILDEVWVRLIKLDVFHVPDIIHYLKLLHQVVFHSFFYHIATCQKSSESSLQNQYVSLYHKENISMDFHSKKGLDFGSCHIEVMNFTTDYQTSQNLLNFFRRYMQSQVFFLRNSIFNPLKSIAFRSLDIASKSTLYFPSWLSIYSLPCILKCSGYYLSSKHMWKQMFPQLVNICSNVSPFDKCLTCFYCHS